MKKILMFLCVTLFLVGCGTDGKIPEENIIEDIENDIKTVDKKTSEEKTLKKAENYTQIIDKEETEEEKARREVIEKFKNERDVVGTGKFIEDTYKQYPNDEVISTIYNYDSAKFSFDAYKTLDSAEWLDDAKSSASKISPEYSGEFSEEIILFVSELLGGEWEEIRKETAKQEEDFKKLSLDDKKEINKFIQSRYDYYDELEAEDLGDKYSDEIWQETSEKYNLPERYISDIWSDIDVSKAIGEENVKSNSNKERVDVYDAILSFNNGNSLITIDEKTLDRFMDALAKKNNGTISELYENNKAAEVPKGTKVNIIESKSTRVKVKILEGLYKDNKAWVLIESIQK